MLHWRLSIAFSSMLRLDAARRTLLPFRGTVAAIAALAATLLLGRYGPALPLPGGLPIEAAGLVAIAGCGLLAWHFARLTTLPVAQPLQAAMTAALVPPLALPNVGVHALIVPAALAFGAGLRHRDQRVVALLVQCGALIAAGEPFGADLVDGFVCEMILGIALFISLKTLDGAANDNPSMERMHPIWRMPLQSVYARHRPKGESWSRGS